MASIVTLPKFIGSIDIVQSNENLIDHLNSIVADKELAHIERMFGKYSAKWIYNNAGISDTFELVEPFTLNEDYSVFYNGGWFKDDDGNDIHTDGIVTILAYCLYSDLLAGQEKLNTSMGNIAMKERKSTFTLTYEKVSQEYDKLTAWNIHCDMHDRIAEYLSTKQDVYPTNWEVTKQIYGNIYAI